MKSVLICIFQTQIQTKEVHGPELTSDSWGVAVCCEEGEVCSLQKFSILIISSLYLMIKKNNTTNLADINGIPSSKISRALTHHISV